MTSSLVSVLDSLGLNTRSFAAVSTSLDAQWYDTTLVQLAELRRLCDAVEAHAVAEMRAGNDARRAGYSWAEIGRLLGVSPQAAHKKFRHLSR